MSTWLHIWISLTYFTAFISGKITVNPAIDDYLGERVTLECHFNGDDRWFVMQWLKRRPGEEKFTPIISLPEHKQEPEWGSNAGADLRKRISPYIRRKDSQIYFNLAFTAMACDDPGEYRCQIGGLNGLQYTDTSVSLQAFPLTPQIEHDVMTLEINTSVILECSGNVGLPAAELQWYYKTKVEPLFMLVEGQEDQIIHKSEEDCRFIGKKHIKIKIKKNSDGNVYRCAAESRLVSASDPRYYDEVTVRLPEIPTVPPKVSCLDAACFSKREEASNISSSPSSPVYNKPISLFSLLLASLVLYNLT